MSGTTSKSTWDGATDGKGSEPVETAKQFRNRERRRRGLAPVALWGSLLGLAATAPAVADEYRFELRARPHAAAALPPLPTPAESPVQLVVDDDSAEGAFGVLGGQTSRQFYWFNRFGPVPTFTLDEVWVLFPVDAPLGGAIQIAIFEDVDGDPTNGATLRSAFDAAVQAADGNTFSIYPLPAPVLASSGNDLLIGVVPRFIVSGQTPPLLPAALDSTASAGRSWFATWVADPPDPPSLPSDQTLQPVDGIQPGNWMIRGFGGVPSAVEIPALADWGVGALVGLLALGGLALLKRRRAALLLLPLTLWAASAGAQSTIDLFSTNQATLSAPPDSSSTATTGGADIVGTRRGLAVKNLLGAGPTSAGVAAGALTLAITNTTPDSRGEARLSWDGDTNPTVLDPVGLGGVNLTGSFARGFRIRVNSTSVAGVELELAVHTDGANASRAARLLPLIASATDVLIPFSEFRVASGSGADFSDVGALELTVRGRELTVVIDEITTSLPSVAATKVDVQTDDDDSDGQVDPGDRVRYTVTLTNTGNEALNVALTDAVDANTTLVAGSVSATPIARNDQYGWFGNVTLAADGSPFPTLLANDSDPDGDTVTVQSVDAASAQGGSVSLVSAATGEFLYVPPTGFKGVDSFGYTIVDDDAQASAAIAYVSLEGVVWFVDNACAVGCGAGTQASPFPTLTAAEAPSGANDIIFVRTGVASYDTGAANGFALDVDEQLLGEGVALVLGGTTIFPVGTPPTLTNNDGTPGRGLTLAGTGVGTDTVRGLTIGATGAAKIFGNAFGTFASDTVALSGAGPALDLTNGALAATFASLATTTSVGSGIALTQVSGSLTSTGGTTVTDPAGTGIAIATSTAALGFGSTTVGKGSTAGTGVSVTGSSGTTSFSQLAVTTSNGTGLLATGSTLAIGGSASSVAATGGPALDLTAVTLSGGATFASASSTGSTGKGINLDSNGGALVVNGGAITNPGGIAFDLSAGSANVTYAGSVTSTANAFLVEITGRTGGTATLSGNLSGTGSSNGINVANNTGGTIAFSGATKTLSTGGDAAVTLATNGGATINFTGGGLDIDTTSGTGFNATGGATAITVQGSGNSVTATTGVAVNVAATNIGGAGLTFQSITAGTGVGSAGVGISLDGTGLAGGNGGLTVTGNAGAGTGGTIQHKTGADNSTTAGIGIFLKDTKNTSLSWMQLNDFDNSGIVGRNVQGFTLLNSVLNGAIGNASGPSEGAINFGLSNPGGANGLQGTGLIRNTRIRGSIEHNVEFYNQSGAMNLTIEGLSAVSEGALPNDPSDDVADCIIEENTAASGSDGILIEMQGTSTATITIDRCLFRNNKSQAVQVAANDSSIVTLTIDESFVRRFTPSGQGNEGFVLSNGSNGRLDTHVTNNTINGIGGVGIFVGQTAGNANAAAPGVVPLIAVIRGNTVNHPTTATNHAIIAFLTSTVGQVSQANILIDSNNIAETSTGGVSRPILVDTPDLNTTPTFTATVINNNITGVDPGTGASADVTARRGVGCFDVRQNVVSGPFGIRVRRVDPATVTLEPGVSGSPVAATVMDDNHAAGTVTSALGTITVAANNDTCLAPPL